MENGPFGAGSKFASMSLPGDSCWINSVHPRNSTLIHSSHSSLTLPLSDSLNPSHPAYRLLNLTSRKTALHYSPPSPGQDPMHHLLSKLRVSDHHLLDRRVANHGGLELENFEIQISNCRILFWVTAIFLVNAKNQTVDFQS